MGENALLKFEALESVANPSDKKINCKKNYIYIYTFFHIKMYMEQMT